MLDTHPAHGGYTLRPVADSDFDFLWRLKVATLKPYIEKLYGWDEPYAKDMLRQVMHNANLVLIHNEPAGILKVCIEPSYVYHAEIGLLPEHQRKGLGMQIIKDLIAAADWLILPVELQVFAMNPAVIRYERLGFGVTHDKLYRRPTSVLSP